MKLFNLWQFLFYVPTKKETYWFLNKYGKYQLFETLIFLENTFFATNFRLAANLGISISLNCRLPVVSEDSLIRIRNCIYVASIFHNANIQSNIVLILIRNSAAKYLLFWLKLINIFCECERLEGLYQRLLKSLKN